MSDVILSPNMNLPVPIVGLDPGPDWANNINASLGILDQHNHSAGQGVQINPDGLDINADLPINGNNLTLVNTVRFNNLLASLAGTAPNLGVIYEANNELYYNDGVGNVVQVTKAGSVNATSSGISSGTATASFVGGVLVVDANVNTPANVQGASFLFGNNISGSNYLTLQPPSAMGSSYSVTLPPPNTTGSLAYLSYDTSNNIGVAGLGTISGAYLEAGTVPQSSLAPRSTGITVGAGGVAVSNPSNPAYATSSTTPVLVTNLQVTITTTGRPVQVELQGVSGGSSVGVTGNSNSVLAVQCQLQFQNGGTTISLQSMGLQSNPGSLPIAISWPASSFNTLDMTVNGAPGTYTYSVFVNVTSASYTMSVSQCVLVAYEI
jgi:hypothetical protein